MGQKQDGMVANNTNYLEVDGLKIQLRRPEFAAFLAWLIPGAGHYYQGRYGKAAMYCVSILSLFVIGMVLGGGKVVYWSWEPEDRRYHYLCQVGVGLPALPAAISGWYAKPGSPPIFGGFMAKPNGTPMLDNWHKETSHGFDLGGLYTMIAGLLNYLVIFDAYSGPLPLLVSRKEKSSPATADSEKS